MDYDKIHGWEWVGALNDKIHGNGLADQEKMKKCKCDENAVYNLLKTGMIGGFSIVLC